MGVVGLAALLANGAVALLLWRHRGGDVSGRWAWVCSRNDAVGNLVVLLAAAGAFGGSKALAKAVRKAFGGHTPIQRCQIHKARNILERLPKHLHVPVRTALRQAWEMMTPRRPSG